MVLFISCIGAFIIGWYIAKKITFREFKLKDIKVENAKLESTEPKKDKIEFQLSELKVGDILNCNGRDLYYIITDIKGEVIKEYHYITLNILRNRVEWVYSQRIAFPSCCSLLIDNSILLEKLEPYVKAIKMTSSITNPEYYVRDGYLGKGIILRFIKRRNEFWILFPIYQGLLIDHSAESIIGYCSNSEIIDVKGALVKSSEEFLNIYKLLC